MANPMTIPASYLVTAVACLIFLAGLLGYFLGTYRRDRFERNRLRRLVRMEDLAPAPTPRGWFAFRTETKTRKTFK